MNKRKKPIKWNENSKIILRGWSCTSVAIYWSRHAQVCVFDSQKMQKESHQYVGIFMESFILETIEHAWLHVWSQSGNCTPASFFCSFLDWRLACGCQICFLSQQLHFFKCLCFSLLKPCWKCSSPFLVLTCPSVAVCNRYFFHPLYTLSMFNVYLYIHCPFLWLCPDSHPFCLLASPTRGLMSSPPTLPISYNNVLLFVNHLKMKTFIKFVCWQFCTGLYAL